MDPKWFESTRRTNGSWRTFDIWQHEDNTLVITIDDNKDVVSFAMNPEEFKEFKEWVNNVSFD